MTKKRRRIAALRKKTTLLGSLVLCSILPACASQHTVALRYLPSATQHQTDTLTEHALLCVAVFNDARQTQDQSVIGKRVGIDGAELPVYCRPLLPTYATAVALRKYLFGNGCTVFGGIPFWDLDEKTIDPGWGLAVIGGEIQDINIVCVSGFLRTNYTVTVKLAIVVADVRRRKTVYKTTVQSASARSDFLFSEERLEREINRNLSAVVESLFSDRTFREKLRCAARGYQESSLR